ncbi:MAG TPA: DUF2092 domain-containing protein [Puia sp.]|nr:DUF2092 domain-containing protein [Puia sp.]
MKKIFILFSVMMISLGIRAQSKSDDSVAVLILDRMSGVISDMESCSFKLTTEADVMEHPYGLVKKFGEYETFMSGPNKMMVIGRGYKGHRQFVYNGQQLAYYSFDEHNYGAIPAPSTTIRTIDSVHSTYGIEFPAADFFYPAFTDDLIENTDSIRFLGTPTIEGKQYFHIIAYAKEMNLQFWINDDAYTLPGKFSITYKNQEGNPQYLASFSDWQINPELPDAMFDFYPPPGSRQIRIMSKNER